MNAVLNRLQVFSNAGAAKVSKVRLILTTIAHSFWLLSRSFKIIFILHKEMLNHLVGRPTHRRANFMNRNIFYRYGTWFIDMDGLINEQMGV
jgi:hypothetical protein